MKTIKKTLLHYQKGTSNKVYNVYLVEVSTSEYLVNFEYGRFGSTLREGTKTSSPVALERAQKLFDSLVVSKINKDYVVKQGYDATKQEEKKEREVVSSSKYKRQLVERLTQALEEQTPVVENYHVSKLIYKVGALKVQEAKSLIVAICEKEQMSMKPKFYATAKEKNVFYYAVVWALGRYQDPSLRETIEGLREELNDSSRYIVEEALFLLKEEKESKEIATLTLPKPFSVAHENKNSEKFVKQVELLEEMISETLARYKNMDSWFREERQAIKEELMPLLSKADEIYLKLYMLASVDTFSAEILSKIVRYLPMTEFNFSLFRRLYKMADMRDDHEMLAQLITKIESKKMACYEIYAYSSNAKPSLGCSRLYFKKRSLRYLEQLAHHDEESYIAFSKQILLSANGYESEFKAFTTEYYDDDWNLKTKKYDAYAVHLTFMKILFGEGKRYMIAPSKKMWEVANKSIKDEVRPEWHKTLWDNHALTALEILSKSSVEVVQHFAFAVLKDNLEVLEHATLAQLLPLLNLESDEARGFFFELLKKRYEEQGEVEIIKAALLSSDDNIALYALEVIAKKSEILYEKELVSQAVFSVSKYIFNRLVPLLKTLESVGEIVDDIVSRLSTETLPLEVQTKLRAVELLSALAKGVESRHIETLMQGREVTDRHIVASLLIRDEAFDALEISLELKEKIANFNHPEMLATTIYLLGKLSAEELMEAHEMLVAFLYHEENAVHEEARKIIEKLAQNKEDGAILLKAIVEKSFVGVSDEVGHNVTLSVNAMRESYKAIEPDQLYRMLIAKSKLAVALGSLILLAYNESDFSVTQWARIAKNPNKAVRVWAYDAYKNNVERVKEAMPKSLMIFDTAWEDTRLFAMEYFENFSLTTDEIVVIADSNHNDVQMFVKRMIEQGEYDTEVLLTKLSQHPSLTIQKFVTDLMLGEMSDEQLLKMERFFNTLLHSVNQNRVAKSRTMLLLKKRLENPQIAQMVGRLAGHHSATMVWSDKEIYVEMMSYIAEHYKEIALPLSIEEVEKREVV
jgi:hypothetical protein